MSDKNIWQKLLAVQSSVVVPKNQYNSFGKYKYRNCEDILEGLKPHLREHELLLFVSDDIVLIEGRFYIKATVTVTDGKDSIVATGYAREADTKKGMDDAQVTGAASSYARKYALAGLFLLDDNKDADNHQEPPQKQQPRQQPPPPPPPPPQRGYNQPPPPPPPAQKKTGNGNGKSQPPQNLTELYNLVVKSLQSKGIEYFKEKTHMANAIKKELALPKDARFDFTTRETVETYFKAALSYASRKAQEALEDAMANFEHFKFELSQSSLSAEIQLSLENMYHQDSNVAWEELNKLVNNG